MSVFYIRQHIALHAETVTINVIYFKTEMKVQSRTKVFIERLGNLYELNEYELVSGFLKDRAQTTCEQLQYWMACV